MSRLLIAAYRDEETARRKAEGFKLPNGGGYDAVEVLPREVLLMDAREVGDAQVRAFVDESDLEMWVVVARKG